MFSVKPVICISHIPFSLCLHLIIAPFCLFTSSFHLYEYKDLTILSLPYSVSSHRHFTSMSIRTSPSPLSFSLYLIHTASLHHTTSFLSLLLPYFLTSQYLIDLPFHLTINVLSLFLHLIIVPLLSLSTSLSLISLHNTLFLLSSTDCPHLSLHLIPPLSPT